MAAFFSHLECSVPCGAGPYDPRHLHQRCSCGAPLFARYDLTAARRVPRSALAGRDATMWRYREVMPLLESAAKGLDLPVTLGEGWTPLVRTRRLAEATGLKRLYVKDEGRNPTGSWKARGASAAVTRALHVGVKTIAATGSIRAAEALAAYAARSGMASQLVVPASDLAASRVDLAIYGAKVQTTDKPVDTAEADLAKLALKNAWCLASSGAEPYRLEGQKTIAYEIAEQLGWEVPDWILCPTGSGTAIAAMAKAFVEMAGLGWIDPVRRPHLVAVQAAGCAPLVRSLASDSEQIERWQEVQTRATELAVPTPALGVLALRAIKATGGAAIGAGDLEMTREATTISSLEGISAALGAGAALHAARILVAEGRIKPHDTVVIVNPSM